MAIACYAHPRSPTVAECADCSRGLCTVCERILRPPLCAECATVRAKRVLDGVRGRLTAFCVFGALGLGLGIYLGSLTFPHALFGLPLPRLRGLPYGAYWLPPFLGYFLGGAVYGRHVLMRGRGGGRFIMTFSLMLTLGVITTVLGAFVGLVATPFVMLADLRLKRTQIELVDRAHSVLELPPAASVASMRLG